MKKIGTRFGLFLFDKGLLEYEYIDYARYFVEICFSEYLPVICLMIISIYLDRLLETLVYLFLFIPLRQALPGYHCSTILRCNLLSNTLHMVTIFSDIVKVNDAFHILIFIVVSGLLLKSHKIKSVMYILFIYLLSNLFKISFNVCSFGILQVIVFYFLKGD